MASYIKHVMLVGISVSFCLAAAAAAAVRMITRPAAAAAIISFTTSSSSYSIAATVVLSATVVRVAVASLVFEQTRRAGDFAVACCDVGLYRQTFG